MATAKAASGRKWIFGFIALCATVVTIITISFLNQLSEWFDFEAKISNFVIIAQMLGLAVGLVTFVIIAKNHKSSMHLNEVYSELIKVVWADRDAVTKMTIGILFGCAIASSCFLVIDIVFRKLLEFAY